MKQEFDAVIKQHEDMDGAYIEPPFDAYEVFGAKRVKVIAAFDGVEYRGSLVRMGGCYMLGITKEIRKKTGKGFGDTIHVTIEKDEALRVVDTPEDFMQALICNTNAAAEYEKLSYSHKKEYAGWINEAKSDETRLRRINKAVELLCRGKN